jgi:hypothetical protein
MNFKDVLKKIGQGALIGGRFFLNTNPATAMIDDLVGFAESAITGRHQGTAKMDMVLNLLEPALRELDNNDEVEWGVKDWGALISAIKASANLAVEAQRIRAAIDLATTWGDDSG